MGNAAAAPRNIVLDDGTVVGAASESGEAFAKAVARMHCIFRDCDAELAAVSDAINTAGKKSEAFTAAAQRLQACQRRRHSQLDIIESSCGTSQEAYRLCVQERGGREHMCLPVLHSFLDCAERALGDACGGTSEPPERIGGAKTTAG
jgi:hypothetical protein